MLQNPAWQANNTVARAQLALFQALSDQISLTQDDRRRALNLDDGAWAAWVAFGRNGALPAVPPLPDMLRRVGEIAFNLSLLGGSSQVQTTASFPPELSTR